MIVIFIVALIVVGPDKLPGLARSLAKGLMEMKKTLEQVKDSLNEENEELDEVRKGLKKTADELREKMIDADPSAWQLPSPDSTQKHTDTDTQPVNTPPHDEQLAEIVPLADSTETSDTESGATNQHPAEVPREKQPASTPEKQHA